MIASHRSNTSMFRFFRGAATRCLLVAVPLAVSPAAHATSYNLTFVIDPTGNGNINLLGINDSGVIGGFDDSSGFTLPCRATSRVRISFALARRDRMVTGINAAGDTSGIYMDAASNTHGFTDIGGTFKTVDNPLSTVFNQALGINNSNETVGYYRRPRPAQPGDNSLFAEGRHVHGHQPHHTHGSPTFNSQAVGINSTATPSDRRILPAGSS